MTSPDYCTEDDVAALTIYTRGKQFYDADAGDLYTPAVEATNPSKSAVDSWITQVSRMMDAALASHWFIVPVPTSLVDVLALLKPQVARIVADMCDDANSAGRFYSERVIDNGLSKMGIIVKDLDAFVATNEDGLLAMGLTQVQRSAQKSQITMQVRSIRQYPRRSG